MDIFVNNSGQLNKLLEQAQGIAPMADVSFPLVTSQAETALGGQITWNQLVQNGDFSNGITDWIRTACTISALNGVLTASATGAQSRIRQDFTGYDDHVLFTQAHIYPVGKTTTESCFVFYCTDNINVITPYQSLQQDEWGYVTAITKFGAAPYRLFLRFNSGQSVVGDIYYCDAVTMFDLTIMFGPAVADYVYRMEQDTPGAGVKWFRDWFNENYYPYDPGTVKPFNQTLFFNI